jgi:hypothetical protein
MEAAQEPRPRSSPKRDRELPYNVHFERSLRTDLVPVSGIVVDHNTDLGVFCRIREQDVFIPLFLIGTPRPAMEPGDVVTLSIARWFARTNHLTG